MKADELIKMWSQSILMIVDYWGIVTKKKSVYCFKVWLGRVQRNNKWPSFS